MHTIKEYRYYRTSFVEFVSGTLNTDYAQESSVRYNNRCADGYRKCASCIDKYCPQYIDDFSELLKSELPEIRLCCAVCLLELMHYNEKQEIAALSIIEEARQSGDLVEKAGWEIWLKNWRKGRINTVYNRFD